MNKKRITSKELAKLAGVSSATISRAFSPDSRIGSATRDRVLSIARQYDYQPNAIARSLNNQRSRLVAVVVNAIGNPCEAEQMQLLVHRLQERGLLPIMLCCGGFEDRLKLMRLASTYQVDHVIVFSDAISMQDAVEIFRMTRPIILSYEPLDNAAVSQIRIDGSVGAEEIIARMVADGRRHFAYLSGRASSWIDKQRQVWFAEALARHGLAFEAEAHGDYSYESGFKEAVPLLHRSRIDALICGNDVMAIGARDAARGVLNKRVPEDLGIVGHDGIAMASWESNDLTTLCVDQARFIDAAIQLVDLAEAGEEPPPLLRLDCTVRWGATT
ncbi:substrate-binding domain-containing protein [Kaistia dalseonensis]|uniref:DNA-binding LacI/PurR family transcriptional regulator n=1 Tax=Kaistia dalseonensis TaxID=410840 RepID=A0ABU0HAT7_9HYPH|nr:substrate-binding domain-containing protein [Kaistia dalseonensis]MCX5496801.1 substrate-binding domain-containing protein [Kaistia dalseonensis]MDQ0439427.1 DNA-binding LacI/PurR family transcriptional regulator [Kaistia dalseonensis]